MTKSEFFCTLFLVKLTSQIFGDFSAKLIVDQEQEIKCITETESLTVEQIQELSPHSAQYIMLRYQSDIGSYTLYIHG